MTAEAEGEADGVRSMREKPVCIRSETEIERERTEERVRGRWRDW